MFVSGVPGLRVTAITREHAGPLSDLVSQLENTYFGVSQTNVPEVIGTLHAPELHGRRGTAGVWDGDDLVACLLCYDGLEHEQEVFADLFVGQHPQRQHTLSRLLVAAHEYADSLSPVPGAWLKTESFGGDTLVARALADAGFEHHRVYQRMRIDFDHPPQPAALGGSLRAAAMTEDLWPQLHQTLTLAFTDHYDTHPLPLDLFQQAFDRQSADMAMWRVVFDGPELVAARISSNRYAPRGLGYVDSLAVLREYRHRGIASYLLREAFCQDYAAGLSGTALHCDSANLTGATRLYEQVGMQRDHYYDAWRKPLQT